MAWPPSGVATDECSATAAPPAALISATTSSAGVASVAVPSAATPGSLTTTAAPREASSLAWIAPSPRPAPVMMATLFSNEITSASFDLPTATRPLVPLC